MNPKSTRNLVSPKKASATELRSFRTFLLMQQFAAQEIGARIAQARKEAGDMPQHELADALGVSTRQLQNYEAGATIPWKHFSQLEQIFERPLTWWLRGEEEPLTAQSEVLAELQVVRNLVEELAARLNQEGEEPPPDDSEQP